MIAWLALVALFVVPMWRIFQRAGLNPAITLFWVVPVLGPVLVLLVLAFSTWAPAGKDGGPAGQGGSAR